MSPRKQYTLGQKVDIAETFCNRQRQHNNTTRRGFAREAGVDASQLRRWVLQLAEMKAILAKNSANVAARTIHSGRKSFLEPVEDELLHFIFSNREQGMSVSIRMVTARACQLSDQFCRKTVRAKDHAVRRFVRSHGIVHRVHTHQSQRNMEEVTGEATRWMEGIRPLLAGSNRHQDWILNMDQTPIFFSMVPRRTLNAVGRSYGWQWSMMVNDLWDKRIKYEMFSINFSKTITFFRTACRET